MGTMRCRLNSRERMLLGKESTNSMPGVGAITWTSTVWCRSISQQQESGRCVVLKMVNADPLVSCAKTWEVSKGHDAFCIRGRAGAQKHGLGVYLSEYVVFQPCQIFLLHKVVYMLK